MKTNNILVVDPDEDISHLLAEVLRIEGYEVVVVPSLEEARRHLSDSHFDAVITEAFGQNRSCAFESAFLKEVKRVTNGTPVILCSTYCDVHHIRPGDHGLAEVLAKPFDIDELSRKVNTLVGRPKVAVQIKAETEG